MQSLTNYQIHRSQEKRGRVKEEENNRKVNDESEKTTAARRTITANQTTATESRPRAIEVLKNGRTHWGRHLSPRDKFTQHLSLCEHCPLSFYTLRSHVVCKRHAVGGNVSILNVILTCVCKWTQVGQRMEKSMRLFQVFVYLNKYVRVFASTEIPPRTQRYLYYIPDINSKDLYTYKNIHIYLCNDGTIFYRFFLHLPNKPHFSCHTIVPQ